MSDLQRFIDAQKPVLDRVIQELREGRKRSHWMWFIFPQVYGLGESEMSVKYAIHSREEAKAYLNHPLLGARLRECTALVNAIKHRQIDEVFEYPDNLKFQSSMTLFEDAAPAALDSQIFQDALDKYFAGELDRATLKRLRMNVGNE